MTATTAERPPLTRIESTPPVPLSRLVKVELRKAVDTRAGKWLLILIAAITALAVVLVLFVGNESELTYNNFLSATGGPQGYLLPVLGVLAITSEWSQRTGLVTFTLEPSRSRVVAAKFIAMVLFGLAAVIAAYALAAGGNLLGIVLQNGDGSWHYAASWVGEVGIGQVIGIIEGLGFGMLLMNSAAAIVAYFVAPIAFSVVFELVGWLHPIADWVDLNRATTPLFDHDMTGHAWLQLATALMLWIGLPLLVGIFRLMRSEVK